MSKIKPVNDPFIKKLNENSRKIKVKIKDLPKEGKEAMEKAKQNSNLERTPSTDIFKPSKK